MCMCRPGVHTTNVPFQARSLPHWLLINFLAILNIRTSETGARDHAAFSLNIATTTRAKKIKSDLTNTDPNRINYWMWPVVKLIHGHDRYWFSVYWRLKLGIEMEWSLTITVELLGVFYLDIFLTFVGDIDSVYNHLPSLFPNNGHLEVKI